MPKTSPTTSILKSHIPPYHPTHNIMSFSSRRRNYMLTSHRRDGLIEWMKSMLHHSFVLDMLTSTAPDTFSHFENLISEHRLLHPVNSSLSPSTSSDNLGAVKGRTSKLKQVRRGREEIKKALRPTVFLRLEETSPLLTHNALSCGSRIASPHQRSSSPPSAYSILTCLSGMRLRYTTRSTV